MTDDAMTGGSASGELFRCSEGSRGDAEPLAGTAPTEVDFLFLEHVGSWGRQALVESRLPVAVRDHLTGLAGTRVQLIRRHGGQAGPGVRVFRAVAHDAGFTLTTALLDRVDDVVGLDLEHDLVPYEGRLWLVCTNGRRDRCCTEIGRPVAAALARHWPEETWETTHLGGHRFAGTLLALPSGHTLGPVSARDRGRGVSPRSRQGGVPVG